MFKRIQNNLNMFRSTFKAPENSLDWILFLWSMFTANVWETLVHSKEEFLQKNFETLDDLDPNRIGSAASVAMNSPKFIIISNDKQNRRNFILIILLHRFLQVLGIIDWTKILILSWDWHEINIKQLPCPTENQIDI